MKKTIAVPSFSRDYPSTKVLNLTLAPNYLSRATTATGSVADRILPSAQASNQVRSLSSYIKITLRINAIMKEPTKTPGPAKIKML